MLSRSAFVFLATLCSAVRGISVTSSTASYVVNTEGSDGIKVTISRDTCDITSLVFRSKEYQYSGTASHIASGLPSGTTVSYKTSGDYVIVSCVNNSDKFDLTHYFVFEDQASQIYMGTYTVSEPTVGELRYIARLVNLPSAYKEGIVSDTTGGTAIEASDVYSVSGVTRSKFYSSERFIDDDVYCAYASDSSVHACFVATAQSREKSSGGPFFRDININNHEDYNSLTFYMNSGHVQTESYRMGFHGPYVLSFTGSAVASSNIDTSFFEELGLTGYVGSSGRGYVKGTASGVSSSLPIVVHWHNDDYQSWVYASSSGSFTSPALVAGTYTMALYQDEFLAATATVTVTAAATTTQSISATNTILTGSHTTVFKIGEYDGKPTGFRNAANQLRMHPSDSRMSSWSPGTYTVGSSSLSSFPMALFKDVNSPQAISFTLSAAVSSAATIRVATTLSFASGRPQVTVNSYACANPSAPTKIDSRGVTRGAYRGYGNVYDCTLPAGTLVKGTNTVSIAVISGESGDDYLSPNFIFDAVELFY